MITLNVEHIQDRVFLSLMQRNSIGSQVYVAQGAAGVAGARGFVAEVERVLAEFERTSGPVERFAAVNIGGLTALNVLFGPVSDSVVLRPLVSRFQYPLMVNLDLGHSTLPADEMAARRASIQRTWGFVGEISFYVVGEQAARHRRR